MEFNKEELQKAANLPSDQFAELIYAVMLAAGANKTEASAAMLQAGNIKRRIASASDVELSKLAASLPPETINAIKNTLETGGMGSGNG